MADKNFRVKNGLEVGNNFTVDAADGKVTLAQNALIQYDENGDRHNRPNFQSSSGNTSGVRVVAPNATSSAVASVSAFNTNDADNGQFITMRANGGTNPLRIQMGSYTSGTLAAAGTSLAFIDNTTLIAGINPSGPSATTDLTTKTYVDTAIANLVDSAPTTLDTLNELAAALGDDPNYATTIATALGTKLNTADFTSTANTWLATKTTDNVTEGSTNKYFSNTLARGSVSGGTGVTYDSGTGVIAIGQAVGTTDDVVFDTVDANIVDGNYVAGQIFATRNTSYVPPTSALTTISGQNGIVVASSTGGANGYGAGLAIRYHSGDTTAGLNNSAAMNQSGATGTSSAPGGVSINQVLGTFNFDGYTAGTSNNYATQIATTNQGAGVSAIQPLQVQGYARQAFTNSTTLTTAVTGASGTGSVATLTFTTQNTGPYFAGQTVTIAGMTPSGYNGTYVLTAVSTSSISYANATTGFTSGGTIAAANTVTAAGTGFRIRGYANSTNMTVPNRINFMDLTASAATFKADAYTFANSVVTGSTLTATNYLTLGSTGAVFRDTATNAYVSMGAGGSTFTVTGINNFVRTGTNNTTQPALLVRYSRTDTTGSNDNDGVDFRLGTGGTSTTNNIARFDAQYKTSGLHTVGISVSADSFAADTDTVYRAQADKTVIRATPTGTTGTASDIIEITDAKILNRRPHRSDVTTATIARGSTYTPAASVNNFIELTLTAGTDPTYIDVDNLTVAGEGGHQAILVYNNSGSTVGNGDLVIRNNGNTINSTQDTIANGARVIFTVYCVGNYASCEYMIAG